MASNTYNLNTYKAILLAKEPTITVGETGKTFDGTINISFSKDEILGSSTSAYFLRGDKTWSNTLTDGLVVSIAKGTENHFIARASGYTDSKNLDVKLMVSSDKKNHGVYSTGYSTDGNAFTSDGKWMIYRNSAGTVIVNGDCTGSSGSCTGLAAKATADGSGNTITSYYCTLSTAQTFTGNKTFNSICYFANGTTYYVNKSGDCRLRYLGCGNLNASTSYAIRIGGNAYISGHHYFGNGTTYYINNSGTGNLNALTVNATTASSSTGTGALIVKGGIGAAGKIYGSQVYNAVWNDYAECRQVETEEPGYCVTETESGKMIKTYKRLQAGCKLTSDTYGTCMGETEEAKTPIAVAGRVLAYPYRAREKYTLGAAVCSAPNGTVDIMTRDEIMMYPERIVGTVSEIPNYEVWHGGSQDGKNEIQVNGRIWIYVR